MLHTGRGLGPPHCRSNCLTGFQLSILYNVKIHFPCRSFATALTHQRAMDGGGGEWRSTLRVCWRYPRTTTTPRSQPSWPATPLPLLTPLYFHPRLMTPWLPPLPHGTALLWVHKCVSSKLIPAILCSSLISFYLFIIVPFEYHCLIWIINMYKQNTKSVKCISKVNLFLCLPAVRRVRQSAQGVGPVFWTWQKFHQVG